MNHRIESMRPSASMVLMAKAKELQKQDPTVIGLAGGEPDFSTPDRISMAAIRSLSEGYTHYVVGPGLPELRAAIRKKLLEENGIDWDENCILVTPGGKNAIYLAVQALLNEGDEAIVLDPAWVSYEPIIQAAGGVTVKVKLDQGLQDHLPGPGGCLHQQDPAADHQLPQQPHRPHPPRGRGRHLGGLPASSPPGVPPLR